MTFMYLWSQGNFLHHYNLGVVKLCKWCGNDFCWSFWLWHNVVMIMVKAGIGNNCIFQLIDQKCLSLWLTKISSTPISLLPFNWFTGELHTYLSFQFSAYISCLISIYNCCPLGSSRHVIESKCLLAFPTFSQSSIGSVIWHYYRVF